MWINCIAERQKCLGDGESRVNSPIYHDTFWPKKCQESNLDKEDYSYTEERLWIHIIQPAGQSSIPAETRNNDTSLCDDLLVRIQNALLSEAVIGTIVRAVADAILESVTSKVYEIIDFDIKAKTKQIKELEKQVKEISPASLGY